MKKVFLAILVAGLFFGCSSKKPTIEIQSTDIKKDVPTSLTPVYFDFDKYFVRDDQFGSVAGDSIYLNNGEVQGSYVILGGNCDEWGSDEYNYALGLKRAKAVKDELVTYGVSESRINLISNGESKPVCTNHNEDCWSMNRRVDVDTLH